MCVLAVLFCSVCVGRGLLFGVDDICEAIRQGATRENLADWIMNRIPGQSFVMENNMLLGPRVTWADNGNVDSFVSSVIRVDENGDFVPFGDVDTTGLS